ncbi:MAG: Fur family transcriptional regulator [Actinomycetia bacterium]|nr:Fur family transcriptional regulator [Actinomycetes bacterium]
MSSTGSPQELAASLRAAGMRVTATRERVYAAVTRSPHATPETLTELVNNDEPAIPPSSVYRALDALEEAGLVTHTHLDHHAPTYHRADHAQHLHLVCRDCGAVTESPAAVAEGLVAVLADRHGFAADVTHMAIHGRCSACRT